MPYIRVYYNICAVRRCTALKNIYLSFAARLGLIQPRIEEVTEAKDEGNGAGVDHHRAHYQKDEGVSPAHASPKSQRLIRDLIVNNSRLAAQLPLTPVLFSPHPL